MTIPKLKRRTNRTTGETWWAEWWQTERIPGVGERRVHRSASLGLCSSVSRRSAAKGLRKLLAEKPQTGWTLRQFALDVWLPPRALRWARNTARTQASLLEVYVLPAFGDWSLDAIRKMDVEAWVGKLDASHGTVKNALIQLRSILAEAISNELLVRNPATKVQVPPTKRQPKRTQPYSPEEVKLILAHVTPTDRLMLRVLLLCGLRPGEMLALRAADVQDGFLLVDESTDGGARFKSTKTRRTRSVPLPPRLLKDLNVWRAGMTDEQPMFVSARRHIYTVSCYLRRIKTQLEGVLDGFDLRRGRATTATHLEGDLADTAATLGHTDTRMTMDHYKAAVPERQRKSAAKLERSLIQ